MYGYFEKGKEQDGMMLAKVKEQDGIMLAKLTLFLYFCKRHPYTFQFFVKIMPRGRRGIFRVGRKTRWRLHLG